MSETTAIQKRGWHDLDMANPGDLGTVFAASGLFRGVRGASEAMVKILAGRELGIGAFASMTNIDLVEGQARMRSNLLATMVKQSPRYDYRVREWTEEVCRIEFYWCPQGAGRESIGFGEWTIKEAKRAGLVRDRGAWEKYPKAMLFARAMSNGVRAHCPDVTAGIPAYTEGDFPDVARGPTTVSDEKDPLDALLDGDESAPAAPEPAIEGEVEPTQENAADDAPDLFGEPPRDPPWED